MDSDERQILNSPGHGGCLSELSSQKDHLLKILPSKGLPTLCFLDSRAVISTNGSKSVHMNKAYSSCHSLRNTITHIIEYFQHSQFKIEFNLPDSGWLWVLWKVQSFWRWQILRREKGEKKAERRIKIQFFNQNNVMEPAWETKRRSRSVFEWFILSSILSFTTPSLLSPQTPTMTHRLSILGDIGCALSRASGKQSVTWFPWKVHSAFQTTKFWRWNIALETKILLAVSELRGQTLQDSTL